MAQQLCLQAFYRLLIIIPSHFKKCGVSCFTIYSKNCVRVSVRPSVSASFSLSAGNIFNHFLQTCYESWGRSVLGLHMGKLWQISTEVLPLMDVRNWFSLSIFGIPIPIFFKLGMRVDNVKQCVFSDCRSVNFD